MRAKFIYEKFTEDSDPISDMGIGLRAFAKKELKILYPGHMYRPYTARDMYEGHFKSYCDDIYDDYCAPIARTIYHTFTNFVRGYYGDFQDAFDITVLEEISITEYLNNQQKKKIKQKVIDIFKEKYGIELH